MCWLECSPAHKWLSLPCCLSQAFSTMLQSAIVELLSRSPGVYAGVLLPAFPSLKRFHTFATAVMTLSLRNSDFMLGIRLVTDAALSFQAPFFFFKALVEPFSVTPLSFCSLLIFIKTFGRSEYMARYQISLGSRLNGPVLKGSKRILLLHTLWLNQTFFAFF